MQKQRTALVLVSLEFNAGAFAVGAGLVEIGARLALFSFDGFSAAAFTGLTVLIIFCFAGQNVKAVLFFAAPRRRTRLFLGMQVADVAAGAVAVFTLDDECFRPRLS